MADETISEKCETLYNKLNTFVASVISRDVTPKIANLNTEVWGSDTQTGNSRIDTLNTNFNNLNNSITTINIECSDYNPSIDSNITVTITVTDVFGDAISNESVTVTASEGNFTQLNGSSITAVATVTATTNISGQFTLTYTCSEWGLITFSTKNHNTQINVKGWKQVQTYLNGRLTLFTDGRNGFLKINGSFYPASTNHFLETISSEYKPLYAKIVMASDGYAGQGQHQDIIKFWHSGELYIVSNGGGTHNVYTSIFYPLANPLY